MDRYPLLAGPTVSLSHALSLLVVVGRSLNRLCNLRLARSLCLQLCHNRMDARLGVRGTTNLELEVILDRWDRRHRGPSEGLARPPAQFT